MANGLLTSLVQFVPMLDAAWDPLSYSAKP